MVFPKEATLLLLLGFVFHNCLETWAETIGAVSEGAVFHDEKCKTKSPGSSSMKSRNANNLHQRIKKNPIVSYPFHNYHSMYMDDPNKIQMNNGFAIREVGHTLPNHNNIRKQKQIGIGGPYTKYVQAPNLPSLTQGKPWTSPLHHEDSIKDSKMKVTIEKENDSEMIEDGPQSNSKVNIPQSPIENAVNQASPDMKYSGINPNVQRPPKIGSFPGMPPPLIQPVNKNQPSNEILPIPKNYLFQKKPLSQDTMKNQIPSTFDGNYGKSLVGSFEQTGARGSPLFDQRPLQGNYKSRGPNPFQLEDAQRLDVPNIHDKGQKDPAETMAIDELNSKKNSAIPWDLHKVEDSDHPDGLLPSLPSIAPELAAMKTPNHIDVEKDAKKTIKKIIEIDTSYSDNIDDDTDDRTNGMAMAISDANSRLKMPQLPSLPT